MPTTLDKSIRRQANIILKEMGPPRELVRNLNVYLNCAAYGIQSVVDLAALTGCSNAEIESLTSEEPRFGKKDAGTRVVLDYYGDVILGLCLSTVWPEPPAGLFSGAEADKWDECIELLNETESEEPGLSLGAATLEVYRLNMQEYFTGALTAKELSRREKLHKACGIGFFQGRLNTVSLLVKAHPEFHPYRTVLRKAHVISLAPEPAVVLNNDEFSALVRQRAADLLAAFDALSLTDARLIPTFIRVAAGAADVATIAKAIGCKVAEAEASLRSLGGNVELVDGEYTLAPTGKLLFRNHFLRKGNGQHAETMFAAVTPENLAWVEASEKLLATVVGPGGETLEDISHMTILDLQPDGTPYRKLLQPLGLSLWGPNPNAAGIDDVRKLVAAVPALKPHQKILSYAKRKKLEVLS